MVLLDQEEMNFVNKYFYFELYFCAKIFLDDFWKQ